ncbi:MAG: hypothetical protein KDB61_01120 [Planctomycetes bacterium]|nr:hypothetical protein [Planctomycetota bacterium]
MLLETLLAFTLAPITATTAAQEAPPSLAWSIPDDALMSFRWKDPKGLIANEQKNNWISLLSDPRVWESDLFQLMDRDIEAPEGTKSAMFSLFQACSEMVAWVEPQPEFNALFALAMRAEEKPIAEFMKLATDPIQVSEEDGITYYAEDGIALAWGGDLVLLYGQNIGTPSRADMVRRFKAIKAQTSPAGPFESSTLGTDRNADQLEFLIGIDAVLNWVPEEELSTREIPEPFLEELREIEWVYTSAQFGAGVTFDSEVVAPFKPDGYLARFLGFAAPVDAKILKRVPEHALGAMATQLDFKGAFDWVASEMIAAGAMTQEDFEMAMFNIVAAFDFDLEKDLLGELRGDILQITFPVDDIEDPMKRITAYTYGMWVLGVSDGDTVSETLSSIMAVLSDSIEIEATNPSWGSKWAVDIFGFLGLDLAVSKEELFLSAHPNGIEQFMDHVSAEEPPSSFYDLPTVQKCLKELTGTYLYLYRTSAMMDSTDPHMEALMEGDDNNYSFAMIRFMGLISNLAGEQLDGIIGTSITLDSRIRSKTIVR